MGWKSLGVLFATSCGRIGFAPSGADGSSSDGTNTDGTSCGGTVHTVVDGFDDGTLDTGGLYSQSFCSSGMSLAESGGRLVVTFATGTSGDLRCGHATPTIYDLRDSRIFIEVVQAPDPQAQVYFSLDAPNMNSLYIAKESTFLSIRKDVGGVESFLLTPVYDAIQHRWWQLRETAGTTYWETSTDGASWTVRYSEATPFDVSAVSIAIFGRTFQAEPNPGFLRLDNLNGGADPITCR